MSSEETPLLDVQSQHEQVYKRFNKRQKRIFLAVVSWCGLLPRQLISRFESSYTLILKIFTVFVSGSLVPSIPKIALDLDTTSSVIRSDSLTCELDENLTSFAVSVWLLAFPFLRQQLEV
jgi:hypothetical protein